MAAFTLIGLESKARAAVIRQLMPNYIRMGFGSNAAHRAIRQVFGAGMNRQAFQSIYRATAGLVKNEENVRATPKNVLVRRGFMTEVSLRRKEFKYRVYIDVTYFDPESGEIISGVRSFYTNNRLASQDYEQDYLNYLNKFKYKKTWLIEKFSLIGIDHDKTSLY